MNWMACLQSQPTRWPSFGEKFPMQPLPWQKFQSSQRTFPKVQKPGHEKPETVRCVVFFCLDLGFLWISVRFLDFPRWTFPCEKNPEKTTLSNLVVILEWRECNSFFDKKNSVRAKVDQQKRTVSLSQRTKGTGIFTPRNLQQDPLNGPLNLSI